VKQDIPNIIEQVRARHPLEHKTLYEGHVLVDLWDALEQVLELHRQQQMVINYVEGVSMEWRKGDLVEKVLDHTSRTRERTLAEVCDWLEDHDYSEAAARIHKELSR
jgi:hypothetical protein